VELYRRCPVFLRDVDPDNFTFTLNTSVASVVRRCVRQCSFSETIFVLRQYCTRAAIQSHLLPVMGTVVSTILCFQSRLRSDTNNVIYLSHPI